MKKSTFSLITAIICSFTILLFLTNSFASYKLLILFCIGIASTFIGTLAGGGGLITIPAMMLAGIPIQTSIATNKFSSGIAAFSNIFYLLCRKKLNFAEIASGAIVAFIGGIGGALFTATLEEEAMNIIALILLLIALTATFKNATSAKKIELNGSKPPNKNRAVLPPLLIAVYDGGFGPGSSTFAILYYMKKCHTYLQAVHFTRVLIFGSCTGSFFVFYHTGFLQWPYAITMACGSIIGAHLGLLALPKVSLKVAKVVLLIVICLLLAQVGNQLIY